MDYEKKYKDALRYAEETIKYYKERNRDEAAIEDLQEIFPELKESEDEKTKRILHSISSKMSFHLRDIFTEEELQCFDAWSNAWLEKQGSIDIDIESMVSSYKQRLKSQGQGNLENNPLINMCVSAFKQGVENTLEELNLKKL